MNSQQEQAFTTAANISNPFILKWLFVGGLFAVLFLWAGWASVNVYRGWADGNVSPKAAKRFAIRVIVLILITLYLYGQ